MQIYITENGEFYYTGQKLIYYDRVCEINKFIQHNRIKTKEKYLCVNLKDLGYKTVNYTINVEYLKNYKKLF